MNATEAYGTTEIGRCVIDGVEYVAYHDGAGSYAVLAADYDDVQDEQRDDAEWCAEAYSLWCSRSGGVSRETSAAVAREVGLDGIRSSDGCEAWIEAAK